VVIDALLPRSPTGAPLHITTLQGRADGSLAPAWLPLAVKGYFKALGGYSIPGSNPAPDVYAFTGWIPERLDLNSGFQREKEWGRVREAWARGSVIVTLGSGAAGEERGLVRLHAYGVTGTLKLKLPS
jgi:calpain-7